MQIERGDTDEAVLAVFAALVWHTQQLREDIQKLGQLAQYILQKLGQLAQCTLQI